MSVTADDRRSKTSLLVAAVGSPVPIVELSFEDAASAQAGVIRLMRDQRAEDETFLGVARAAGGCVPYRVRRALAALRSRASAPSLVVRNFPVDDTVIGPTPEHWRLRPAGGTAEVDLWLVVLAAQLGDLFSWSTLQSGRLLNDVLPIRGAEDDQTGHGSATELDFHVEDAFHDLRCDFLLLLALRNPDRVATTVAGIDALTLDEDALNVLFEARFLVEPDTEHLKHSARYTRPSRRVSALFGDRQSPTLRVDAAYLKALPGDHQASAALDSLHEQLRAALVDVVLEPGDTLIVDNLRAVHGRRPFRARYDGTDRWLRKATVTRDMRSLAASLGGDGRVFRPL